MFPLFRNATCSGGGRIGSAQSSKATPGEKRRRKKEEEEEERE